MRKKRYGVIGCLVAASTVLLLVCPQIFASADTGTVKEMQKAGTVITAEPFDYNDSDGELTPEMALDRANVQATDGEGNRIYWGDIAVNAEQLAELNRAEEAGDYPLCFTVPDGTDITVSVHVIVMCPPIRITFLDDYGNVLAVASGHHGGTLAQEAFPDAPVVKGKEFLGWFTDEGEQFTDASRVKLKNFSVQARYKDALVSDIKGDLNQNGFLDVSDIAMAASLRRYPEQEAPAYMREMADWDGDGRLTVSDLVWMAACLRGGSVSCA